MKEIYPNKNLNKSVDPKICSHIIIIIIIIIIFLLLLYHFFLYLFIYLFLVLIYYFMFLVEHLVLFYFNLLSLFISGE